MDEPWVMCRDEAGFPGELERYLGDDVPERVEGRGDRSILGRGGIALFSSRRCPGDQASRMFDLAQRIRDRGRVALGGFHSPMEKECLRILLRSPHPVVIGLARRLDRARLPAEWRDPVEQGRLLIVSVASAARTGAAEARRRNEVLAALADEVLVAHAEPGGATARLCGQVTDWGKPLFCPDREDCSRLVGLGATPVDADWPSGGAL